MMREVYQPFQDGFRLKPYSGIIERRTAWQAAQKIERSGATPLLGAKLEKAPLPSLAPMKSRAFHPLDALANQAAHP